MISCIRCSAKKGRSLKKNNQAQFSDKPIKRYFLIGIME